MKDRSKRQLFVSLFLLTVVPLILVSFISYDSARKSLRKEAFESLSATVDERASFIRNWFKYRFIDLELQATSINNIRFLNELRDAFRINGKDPGEFINSDSWNDIACERQEDLSTFRKLYGYHDLYLIDTKGNILFTLAGQLHCELEWIPLKAMRKDRRRRYQSAAELAQDIRNYLKGDVLLAGPESILYRIKKRVAKHKRNIVTGAAVLCSLLTGLLVSPTVYRHLPQPASDIDARNTKGMTPLHLVVYNTQTDGDSLVAAGHLRRQKSSTYFSRPPVSSLHLTYWHGEITHHFSCYKPLAVKQGRKDMVALLLSKGANIYARDNEGRTPLHYAKENEHDKTIALFINHDATE